jgi:hypothetical protein
MGTSAVIDPIGVIRSGTSFRTQDACGPRNGPRNGLGRAPASC